MSDLLREAINDEAAEAAAAETITPAEDFEDAPGVSFTMPDLSFLLAKTGPGAVEEYIDHPLNFDGMKSTARILRGLTGIAGELDYALIDIGLGALEKIKERKAPKYGYAEQNRFNYTGQ